jgi:non-specific serine/threonine protein kinase
MLALRAGDQWRAASGLEGLAVVASAQRRSELALRLAGAAALLRERLRAPLPPGLVALFDRRLSAARAELGDEAVALAWEEGRVLPMEELIGSFEEGGPGAGPEEPASAESRKLTPREREVAALVALGLRNYDIAQQLGISRKTAEVHVANVLDKLGMTSRVQLASWALREGLLQQSQS